MENIQRILTSWDGINLFRKVSHTMSWLCFYNSLFSQVVLDSKNLIFLIKIYLLTDNRLSPSLKSVYEERDCSLRNSIGQLCLEFEVRLGFFNFCYSFSSFRVRGARIHLPHTQ